MSIPLKHSAFLADFACLGDKCADTCCKGWGMQLDSRTKEKYEKEAPELLDAVDTGEAEWIMKRDPNTDYCVKFDNGLCGIHKDKGTDFLGDACHFFPRITRSLGDTHIMTAAPSCPEVTRLALFTNDGMQLEDTATDRVPFSLQDYCPDGLTPEQALTIHTAFLEAAKANDAPSSRILSRISSVARSLDMLDIESWPMAVSFYLGQAEGRLPKPEALPADAFNLLHALVGILSAAKPSKRSRLEQTIHEIEDMLNVVINRDTLAISTSENSLSNWNKIENQWNGHWSHNYDKILTKYIQLQVSTNLFPFAGLGTNITERMTILGVRYATTRLALLAVCHAHNGNPPEEEVIRAIQSIARFLDHLADPELSLQIYKEPEWHLEARMRGLVGDIAA